jgi:hypothetical protein
MTRISLTTMALAASALLGFGCKSSTDYAAMEKVGVERREILNQRLEAARNSQVEARGELEAALFALQRVPSAPASELPQIQKDLADRVGQVRDERGDLQSDIAAVESVASSMFADWELELAKSSDEQLREKSRTELEAMRAKYRRLIASLRNTDQRLSASIPMLEDQVMFLEHAATAGAPPPNAEKLDQVQEQISSLIEDLDGSIDSTQKFINEGVEASA